MKLHKTIKIRARSALVSVCARCRGEFSGPARDSLTKVPADTPGMTENVCADCLDDSERDVSTFTLKTWRTPTSQPRTRQGLPYKLAYALSMAGRDYKAQIISRWGVIDFEVKAEI